MNASGLRRPSFCSRQGRENAKGEKNDEFADRRPDVYTAMFRAVNVRFVESGGPRQLERAERAPTRYVACIPRVYLRRVSGN